MVAVPYKVYVVVEREFGEQLTKLPPDAPLWIVNTPPNRAVAERLWKARNQEGQLTGITTFNDSKTSSAEDLLVSELDTIDLHHGFYSANPPYTVLEVLGAPLARKSRLNSLSTGSMNFTPTPQVSARFDQCLPLKRASRLPLARGVK